MKQQQSESAVVDRLRKLRLLGADGGRPERAAAGGDCQLVAVYQHYLLVWLEQRQAVLAVDTERPDDEGCELTPAAGRPSDVRQLAVSPDGQWLALAAPRALTVLQLPAHFNASSRRVSCAAGSLAIGLFRSTRHVRVVRVRWCPDVAGHAHLALLTSDDCLRVFDLVADLETPALLLPLGGAAAADAELSLADCLGDAAVSFTFAPVAPDCTGDAAADDCPARPLTVFVLRGNGEVLSARLDLRQPRGGQPVCRPVALHPAADDNYGVDACDLLCLASRPPLLVVATPRRLHHCVLLTDGRDDAPPRLHVCETVEPAMTLTTNGDDGAPAPVRLHEDPTGDDRYLCSHAAGVHAVLVCQVEALRRFAALPDDSDEPLADLPCVVDHLVCAGGACRVLGAALLPARLQTVLVTALLSSGELVVAALRSRYRPPADEPADAAESAPPAAGRRLAPSQPAEPFDETVRQLLERSASVPQLRGAAGNAADWQQKLELLTGAAHTLRAQYLQKQAVARRAVQLRSEAAGAQLQRQRSQAAQLHTQLAQLQAAGQQAAERLQQLRTGQQSLRERVEVVYRQCQRGVPLLSDAERAAAAELQTLAELQQLRQQMDALRRRQLQSGGDSWRLRDPQLLSLSAAQRELLRDELRVQGDQIAALLTQAQAARKALHA